MKSKPAKKHNPARKLKKHNSLYIRYVSVIFIVLVLLVANNFFVKAVSKTHVLGASTGPIFLADQGDTNQEDNNPVGGNPDNSQPNQQDHTGGITSAITPRDNSPQQSSDNTQVDCAGPDGKHFTTSFHDCQDINQKMGTGTFRFTPLGTPQHGDGNHEVQQPEPSQHPEPTEAATHESIQMPRGTLEVQTEGNKGEFNLESAGTHIEIKKEDNGLIKITARKADGTEVQLQTNAIDEINKSLEGEGVSVSTASANGFVIQSGGVQAETNLPVSIDPTTKTLSVTTLNGTEDITTLPNQAVQNALHQGGLTNILSTANQTTPNATSGNSTVVLTDINNQPAYAVQGVSGKKLFGIFPVAYQKTVYVSAQSGQTLQTQEALFNKILEAFSF